MSSAGEEELASIISPLLTPEDTAAQQRHQAMLYLAKSTSSGETLVLKRTMATTKQVLHSAQNEVSLLRKIRHPNIVAFCGVWTKPLSPGTEINLLLELCAGGNLLDLQMRREQSLRNLTEQEIVRLFLQCCRGVECLHRFDPPVAHRDCKLENFLLGGSDGRTVKLCDLGSATTRRVLVVSKEDRIKLEDEVVRLTTPAYRAPELVDFYSRKLVSEQVDVWALGCLLFALAFKRHLFGRTSNECDEASVLSGKINLPTDPYYSDEFKLMIYWLLEDDPNIRPRIGDVVDELDRLLGNRVKVPADKRGSGTGHNRSASKSVLLQQQQQQQPAPSPSRTTTTFVPISSTAVMSIPRPPSVPPPPTTASRRSQQPESTYYNNNPFDQVRPSYDPTFFSNPGMTSESLTGFPHATSIAGDSHLLSATLSINSSLASPPSQAPIFFSDPPPQWRPQHKS